MDANHIDSYLNVLQRRNPDHWQYRRVPGQDYWQIRYTGCRPPCMLRLELGPTLIYLHTLLGELTIYPECRLALYRYALRLNEELAGAKFGMSHDGKLALMAEWPREHLNFAAFETAIRTLLICYETYYSDIQLVAQTVALADHLTEGERAALVATGEIGPIEVEPLDDI